MAFLLYLFSHRFDSIRNTVYIKEEEIELQELFFMNRCDEFLKQYYGTLSFRDYTLLDRSVRTLEANAAGAPGEIFPWSPMRGIRPSHGTAKAMANYPGVWNWDCAFHAMAVMKWDLEFARDQIRIFLKIQRCMKAQHLWQSLKMPRPPRKPL